MQHLKQLSNSFLQSQSNKALRNLYRFSSSKIMAETYKKSCIFCKIIRKEEPGERVYESEDILCIKDIYPASTHHYLIIPKRHIENAKVLKKDEEQLYDKMVGTINLLSDQQGLDKNSIRTGFHWPPFTTVGHLHLHVISPIENMGFIKNLMFKENSLWFVSTDYVKSRFKDLV